MDKDADTPPGITRLTRRRADAAVAIGEVDTDRPEFLHAVLCQLGLPRSRSTERTFSRSSGGASMLVEAGRRFDGKQWIDMPLPYGTHPRLVLIHLCSEAVRQQSRTIDVGAGLTPFIEATGVNIGGSSWRRFRDQLTALACADLTFGWSSTRGVHQEQVNPIDSSISAWSTPFAGSAALPWPDEIKLGAAFYASLTEHAVPLDPRAVHALQGSSLAIDLYAWLAHRLLRVRARAGRVVTWTALREQFGHEYASPKDFKKQLKTALRAVLAVYPTARVTPVHGGLLLKGSPPPVPRRTSVSRLAPRRTARKASGTPD